MSNDKTQELKLRGFRVYLHSDNQSAGDNPPRFVMTVNADDTDIIAHRPWTDADSRELEQWMSAQTKRMKAVTAALRTPSVELCNRINS